MNRSITRVSLLGLSAVVASWSLGCGSDAAPAQPQAPIIPATGLTPPAATPAGLAGSSAPVAPAPGMAAPTPVLTPPPSAAPTPAPGAAPAPGAMTPTEAPATGAGGARFPDACSERRPSWSKPCTSDPDPCHLNSGYPGDEYCLLPPPEGKGIQVHFGPKSYTDMAEVSKYVLKPGEEFNSYGLVNIPTTETKYFSYMKISMRPGSHHLINNLQTGHGTEGFLRGGAGCDGTSSGAFPGTQNLVTEMPPQGIPAPENEGLGRTLPGNSSICQNYHRYNTTEKPALSEIWYNIWFADEKDVTQKSSSVMVMAGPLTPIPAHTMQVLTRTSTINGEGRILSLFGHRHAATERFATWLNDKLVYDSWDWVESRVFNYDSITQNPATNPSAKTDGATSGVIQIKRGDKVKIECHVNNTTDNALGFANELYTGEMCILFGATVGTPIM